MSALLAGLCAALLAAPTRAAGFHLLKADVLGGWSSQGRPELGLGASLYSEELASWLLFGDPDLPDGHLVKAWAMESRVRGPVMGGLPPSMRALGFVEPARMERPSLLVPFRAWRVGADHRVGRWLDASWSGQVLANLPGLWGEEPRTRLLGPTLGLGLDLCWWEGWRGASEGLINTGKITGQGGLVAGLSHRDALWAQLRLLASVDAFGLHQHALRASGIAGFSLAPLGPPFGMELIGDWERGDDTADLRVHSAWSLRLALSWRLLPREVPADPAPAPEV